VVPAAARERGRLPVARDVEVAEHEVQQLLGDAAAAGAERAVELPQLRHLAAHRRCRTCRATRAYGNKCVPERPRERERAPVEPWPRWDVAFSDSLQKTSYALTFIGSGRRILRRLVQIA
jgi:hypothetical protein